MFTIKVKAGGKWFPTTFETKDLKLALKYASERAAEIGEEDVKVVDSSENNVIV